MKNFIPFLLILFACKSFSQIEKTYIIENTERKILLFEPKEKNNKCPVVFVFHGHGGNARHASKTLNFHDNFPEALVIYLQGIPGVTNSIVDKEGKYNGWQINPGELNDRDIKFFDAVLADIQKKYSIDQDKVYAVGHSNGSRFVNVLWKTRGENFAAFITVAGPGGMWMREAIEKPIWISFGKEDKIVPYKLQKMASKFYLKFQKADLSTAKTEAEITSYQNSKGQEIIIEDRNAGHEFPINSIPQMVVFLKKKPSVN